MMLFTLVCTEVCTLGLLLAVQDDGKLVCRLGRPALGAQGNRDPLQLDKDMVVFLGKQAQDKEDEDKLVPDKEMVCMKDLVWHDNLVEVQGKMVQTVQDSWVQDNLAQDSSAPDN